MNRYGVSVDEIGFESLINDLRTKYLFPLSHYFFPEWTGSSLDSHRAFVVKYKVGEDIDLSYHYDNSEVTLNVSLNNDYIGGELFFGPMRYEDSTLKFGYEHKKGEGVLHRGQQMHGAFPITEGERYNLIIWMRSSFIRNECCPMCDNTPELEPVREGTGDGFTTDVHDLCSVV
ncbi:2-oxoglutarate and iron-dependent oxygenase domain-containing protein 2 [Armadillidium vulgare]|nr:2-oxoglutarate and iron-dependent oxygenase domain-containing protein 2 [Armadillidium vulgare]